MDDAKIQMRKYRRAELISPPNRLKSVVGSGGIDPRLISKAQELLTDNKVDFSPDALVLIDELNTAIQQARAGTISGEDALERIIYPAMQLKAQGSMFHYNLITDICNILINFLETVQSLDDNVMSIVMAHKMSITAVLSGNIKGDGGKIGKELRDELMDACNRYYKKHTAH
jgi:hypothetical protein